MKIHHLNCGTLYPLFPRGTQSILYCLLVETDDGLVLVDTGFGIQDYEQPTRFIRFFTASLGMKCQVEETAAWQVERLGYKRSDVRHIVMTHLHNDHSGGLRDFPEANVHVYAREYEAAHSPKGFKARFYEAAHWSHSPKWEIYRDEGNLDWYGFNSLKITGGFSADMRLIPLPGHTPGHCGVAIQTDTGWLLHCGDATYPFYHENKPAAPFKPLPRYVMSPPKWLEKSLVGEQTTGLKKLYENYGEEIQLICSNDSITYSREVHQG